MNKTFKILKLLLVLTITVTVSACADRKKNNAAAPQAPKVVPAPEPGPAPEPEDDSDLEDTVTLDKEETESFLNGASPEDSKGGQILSGYLAGEDINVVLDELFDAKPIEGRLTDISYAIDQMRADGNYTPEVRDRVGRLQDHIRDYAREESSDWERNENIFDAVAAIAIGGFFLKQSEPWVINPIKNGLKKYSDSRAAKVAAAKVADKAARRSKAEATAAAKSAAAKRAAERAATRATAQAAIASKKAALNVVRYNLNAIMGSKFTAKALGIKPITAQGLGRTRFVNSNIPGFATFYKKGTNKVLVEVSQSIPGAKGVVKHYFSVTGKRAILYAKDGKPLVYSGKEVAAKAAAKMQRGFAGTLTMIDKNGNIIPTTIFNTKNLQKAGVFAATGGLTYYLIRMWDPRYYFMEEYVENIADNGVNLEEYFDLRKLELLGGSDGVRPVLPAPVSSVESPDADDDSTFTDKAREVGADVKDAGEALGSEVSSNAKKAGEKAREAARDAKGEADLAAEKAKAKAKELRERL